MTTVGIVILVLALFAISVVGLSVSKRAKFDPDATLSKSTVETGRLKLVKLATTAPATRYAEVQQPRVNVLRYVVKGPHRKRVRLAHPQYAYVVASATA